MKLLAAISLVPNSRLCVITYAVMGTASTMACIAETLGMSLPGSAAIPAVHSDRLVAAEFSGKTAVKFVTNLGGCGEIMTKTSVERAIRVISAVRCSTCAIVYLTAIAGRLGWRISVGRLIQTSD